MITVARSTGRPTPAYISGDRRIMADEPENLTLRYLRRIDERTGRIEETQTEHGERLTTIERMLAALRREQALDAEARASLEARIDRLVAEVNRIKRRLDSTDAPPSA